MRGGKRSSKLRFHKQEKVYSCAVACLKMILQYLSESGTSVITWQLS